MRPALFLFLLILILPAIATAQTTIRLNESGTGILDDTYVRMSTPGSNFATSGSINAKLNGASPNSEALVKFNLSSLPTDVTVSDAQFCGNVSISLDAGDGDSGNVSIVNVYEYPTYNVSDNEWAEDVLNWTNRPTAPDFRNETALDTLFFQGSDPDNLFHCWNVTEGVQLAYFESRKNISFLLNITPIGGSSYASDGIAIFSKDFAGSPNEYLDVTYTPLNTAPTANAVTVLATSYPSSTDLRLIIDASDADSNLDGCFVGGTFVRNDSAGVCEINITDGLDQELTIWVNDTDNANASWVINFTLTDIGIAQNTTATNNYTRQVLYRNDTIGNGGSTAFNHTINVSTPANGTNLSTDSFSAELAASGEDVLIVNWEGDWIDEAFGEEAQDTSQTTEAGVNAYTQFPFNLSELGSYSWTSVAITQCRNGWDANQSTFDLAADEAFTGGLLGCNSSAAITKALSQWNLTDNATADTTSTGFLEIIANNTDDSIAFSDVLVNASTGSVMPSGWEDSSGAYTISSLAVSSSNFTNVTISTTSDLVTERAPLAAECENFTAFANYCLRTVSADQGGGETLHTYTYRAFLNVTDDNVRHFKVFYFPALDRFTNWNSRNTDSESMTVNDSSTNLSISDNGTHAVMLVDTSYGSSSLESGDWKFEAEWTFTTQVGQSPGGGEGGGGVTFIIVPGANGTIAIRPEFRQFILQPGEEANWTFVLLNPNSTAHDVSLFFEQARLGDDSFAWGLFKVGPLVFTNLSLTVPAGTEDNPGEAFANVLVRVPQTADTLTYRFNLVADGDTVGRHTATIEVVAGGFSFTQTGGDLLGEIFSRILGFLNAFFELPRPVFGVTGFTGWMIAGIAGGIVLVFAFVGSLRWLNTKGRPRR